MKIYDCFPFFNELDLLEMRLEELYDVVDFFVLVEAQTTFSGKPKPLYYQKNQDRFRRFADKIIHVVVSDFPPVGSKWAIERYQRDQLRRGLIDAKPEDLIILSDVDEIPRRNVISAITSKPPRASEVLCLEMQWYFFFLNVRYHETWLRIGPRVMRYKWLTSFSKLRADVRAPINGSRDKVRWLRSVLAMKRPLRRKIVRDAGWHFTWLGGVDAVSEKAGSIPKHNNKSYELEDKRNTLSAIKNVTEN